MKDVWRLAVSEGGLVFVDACDRAPVPEHDHLAERIEALRCVRHERVDRPVGEAHEMLTRVVPAPAPWRGRIEKRLESRVRDGADQVDRRSADLLEGLDDACTLVEVAAVADGDTEHCASAKLVGHERFGRSGEERDGGGEFVRSRVDVVAVEAQHVRRVVQRVHQHAAGDYWPHLVDAELERGHDTEVAATPP
jgi:hypothetical protein